ncbi:site-specific integrase [Larkinella bovis]|uniref:Site-specific integrase n=1 Tax=Larkinella bovis TaxID=683041 RepID=A0ABW0I6R7_9BACT
MSIKNNRLKQLLRIADSQNNRAKAPTFNVGFIARKKASNLKMVSINCILRYNGKKQQFSTGINCKLVEWEVITNSIVNAPEKTRLLNDLKNRAEKLYSYLVLTEQPIDLARIQGALFGESLAIEQVPTLLNSFDQFLDRVQKEYEIGDIKLATYERHIQWAKLIGEFFIEQYGKGCKIEQVTPADAKGLLIGLKKKHRFSHNYTEKIVQFAKRLLNYSVEKEWIIRNPFMNYRGQKVFKQGEILTEKELEMVETTPLFSPALNRIKDVFLFQCYTGLAYADVKNLSPDNILSDQETGWKYIRKDRQKTKVSSTIPLIPQAVDLLEKYANDPYCKEHGVMLPVLTNQKMNNYLKQIAGCLNMTKRLTTHVARRTAASVLMNKGMSLKNVSMMLGHTNTSMTERHYVRIKPATIIRDMENALKSKQA